MPLFGSAGEMIDSHARLHLVGVVATLAILFEERADVVVELRADLAGRAGRFTRRLLGMGFL